VQIDPKSGANFPSLPQAQQSGPGRSLSGTSSGAVDTTAFLPTAALASLIGKLQSVPDVRDDVIQTVQERLGKGDAMTPGASIDTARAILGNQAAGS
jgi:hypothetical protein